MNDKHRQQIKEEVLKEMYKSYPKHKSAVDVTMSNKAIDLAISKTEELLEKTHKNEIKKVDEDLKFILNTMVRPAINHLKKAEKMLSGLCEK